MSLFDHFEATTGIKVAHLLAGLAGGLVRAFVLGGGFWRTATSVICGSLTAAYLTGPVFALAVYYFPFLGHDRSSEYACGYLVGMTAMVIAEGVLRWARRWAADPKLPSGEKP